MADPTPPSDIPDPDSSNPAPAPEAKPAGPKRIRSMPVRERSTTMATSTYVSTSSRSDDANPGRGLTILWTLFLLTAAAEACNAAFYLLAGHEAWPLPYDAGRLALVCSLFLGLYVGWEGLRFLLAAVDLAAGVWFLINAIAAFQGGPKVKAANMTYTGLTVVEAYPKLALGALYLITAVYLVLSSDVLGFIRRRRARGAVGPALLVAVLLFGYLIAVFLAQPIYAGWLRGKLAEAQSYGHESLQMLAEHWDPAYYTAHAEPGSLEDWSEGARKSTFENLSSLGPLQNAVPPTAVPISAKDISPLQKGAPMAGEIISGVSKDGQQFLLGYRYWVKEATFAHGKGLFSFDLVRGLNGPWQLAKFKAADIQKDQPPAPSTPPVDPNAPAAPAASPADAAAPSTVPGASVTPAPSSTVAPPPAAATTPAASPVPSTGG